VLQISCEKRLQAADRRITLKALNQATGANNMTHTRTVTLGLSQELAIRRTAAKHLSGISARQNAASIDLLETKMLLAEIESRSTDAERASWTAQECSLDLL
jgi:hypothetical protein